MAFRHTNPPAGTVRRALSLMREEAIHLQLWLAVDMYICQSKTKFDLRSLPRHVVPTIVILTSSFHQSTSKHKDAVGAFE